MKQEEIDRLSNLLSYERAGYEKGFTAIAGVDEAGRGPLAGPVVAAACIMPKDVLIEGVNDSKKISEKKRDKLFDEILEKCVAYGVGIVEHDTIDEINILNATKLAMKNAIEALEIKPDYVLIDAVKLEGIDAEVEPIIKGDAKSFSIAAASIIAKVTRDRIMLQMDEKYPGYGFAKHKGYGTKAHYEAIKSLGLCEIHRRSFTKNCQ